MKATKIFGYNALICLFAGIFNEIFIELFLDGDLTAKEKIFGALAWCFLFECAFQIVQRFKRIKTLNMLTQKLIEITNQKPSSHILLERGNDYVELARAINAVQSSSKRFLKMFGQQTRDYLSLMESMTSGVVVFDRNKEITLYNHLLEEILVLPPKPRGRPFYAVFHDAKLVSMAQKAYETKEDQHMIWEDQTEGGIKYYDVHAIYVPLSRHHYSVMCLFNDITSERRVAQMQRDFVANVGHELKTPVTAIRGFSETLLEGALDDKEAASEFVKIILEQSKQLTDLINDILSLSKIDTSKGDTFVKIKLRKFIERIMQQFEPAIGEKKISFIDKIAPDVEVVCDEKKLQHIISNLMQNAVRYNKKGGSIEVSAVIFENEWCFLIKDTGQGIKHEDLGRIFERFYRGDKSRSQEGTGLGLSIVKEYVDSLSGMIDVTSVPNAWTEFMVTLPEFSENKVSEVEK